MHTPHTSKLMIASLVLAAVGTARAGSLGANIGASAGTGINGIAGSVGGSAAFHGPIFSAGSSSAAIHAGPGASVVGASSASTGLARAGAAMGASAGGVVFPDVIVDKSDYETIGMRSDHATASAASATTVTAEHEHGLARAIVASDDRVALQAREATAVRLVTSEEIRAASPQQRSQIVGSVAASMADDAKFMAQAKHQQKTWSDAQRADFKVAAQESAARAKVVKKDLKKADKASDEDWAQARAQLATDYAAYAQASDHARAVASANATASSNANAAANARGLNSHAAVTGEANASGQARL